MPWLIEFISSDHYNYVRIRVSPNFIQKILIPKQIIRKVYIILIFCKKYHPDFPSNYQFISSSHQGKRFSLPSPAINSPFIFRPNGSAFPQHFAAQTKLITFFATLKTSRHLFTAGATTYFARKIHKLPIAIIYNRPISLFSVHIAISGFLVFGNVGEICRHGQWWCPVNTPLFFFIRYAFKVLSLLLCSDSFVWMILANGIRNASAFMVVRVRDLTLYLTFDLCMPRIFEPFIGL